MGDYDLLLKIALDVLPYNSTCNTTEQILAKILRLYSSNTSRHFKIDKGFIGSCWLKDRFRCNVYDKFCYGCYFFNNCCEEYKLADFIKNTKLSDVIETLLSCGEDSCINFTKIFG